MCGGGGEGAEGRNEPCQAAALLSRFEVRAKLRRGREQDGRGWVGDCEDGQWSPGSEVRAGPGGGPLTCQNCSSNQCWVGLARVRLRGLEDRLRVPSSRRRGKRSSMGHSEGHASLDWVRCLRQLRKAHGEEPGGAAGGVVTLGPDHRAPFSVSVGETDFSVCVKKENSVSGRPARLICKEHRERGVCCREHGWLQHWLLVCSPAM